VYGNGDLVRLTGGDWDDELDHEGIWPAETDEAVGYLEHAGQSDFHPVQHMDVIQPVGVSIVTVIVERIDPDAIAPAPGTEWCIFAGGDDPDNCAMVDGFGDDEASARETLQFLDGANGKGIAHRSMLPGAWVVERVE
jgi:hypothetical protein